MAVQQKVKGLPVVIDLIAVMYDIVEGTQYSRDQKAYKREECTRSSPVEDPARSRHLECQCCSAVRVSTASSYMQLVTTMHKVAPPALCPVRRVRQGATAPVPSLSKTKHDVCNMS